MTNIYIITNLINNKQYVGKTIKTLQERFNNHFKAHNNKNMYIHQAMRKYGKENFKIELIAQVPDSEWESWEKYYIEFYRTHYTEGGYNISRGGDYNPMNDPIARQHQKESFKNRPYEIKATWLGKHHSQESREKMRQVQKEVSQRPEWKQKHKENIEKQKIKIYMIDNDGNVLKEFDCLSAACKYFGKKHQETQLRLAADAYNKNGTRKKYFGNYWSLNKKV